MVRVIALCGPSASGKSMICKAMYEKVQRTLYIVTSTAKVRERFDSPSYDYLCSLNGNSLMHEYQTAIADNLWKELCEGLEEAQDRPEYYHDIVLDRSPLDAYIYEELFGAVAHDEKKLNRRPDYRDVGFRAFKRFFEEYTKRDIAKRYKVKINLVGLTSLFESNDPKRPSAEINMKYSNEVRRIFTLGKVVTNYPLISMKQLPNTRLDIQGRLLLLENLLQEDKDEV